MQKSLLLAMVLLALSACKKEPDRWEKAAETAKSTVEAKKSDDAPKPALHAGGDFNKFFPAESDGWKRAADMEKEGIAQWKYSKDGKDAMLSIVDTNDKPDAKGKFDTASEKIENFPVYRLGKNKTSILVNGRYQVSISSPTIDQDALKPLFSKFDLKGLSAL